MYISIANTVRPLQEGHACFIERANVGLSILRYEYVFLVSSQSAGASN